MFRVQGLGFKGGGWLLRAHAHPRRIPRFDGWLPRRCVLRVGIAGRRRRRGLRWGVGGVRARVTGHDRGAGAVGW